MNPVPVMNCEVIRGIATTTPLETTKAFAQARQEICGGGDFPAFIVNRILLPMINERDLYAL